MNLTPSNLKQKWASEITPETINIGDEITYVDICNYNRYRIIDKDDTSITIQDVKNEDWIDVKYFSKLNNRWEIANV